MFIIHPQTQLAARPGSSDRQAASVSVEIPPDMFRIMHQPWFSCPLNWTGTTEVLPVKVAHRKLCFGHV